MPDSDSAELERQRLTSLINSMGDGVIAIDQNQKVVVSNGAALNILDVNDSMAGRYIYDILKLVDNNNQPIDITQAIKSSNSLTTSRDWRLIYPDGDIINLYVSITPVQPGYGQTGAQGHVILLRDITREKSLEEERDEFISVASHELRTPITIAEGNIGNAEFIFQKAGVQNPQISSALRQAHQQILFLADIINDLSTLSRAERGQLTVQVTPINVHDLVHGIARNYEDAAEDKGISIVTELDPHLELLHSSELYVREILQNFITNAIKYTEHGQIVLGAQSRPEAVEFFVSDTGIGISRADQQKVFDKFFRADNSQTRATSGTGLGLYVTAKLAKLLKAQIRLTSELGQGSTFSIQVPNSPS